ncbi:CHAT domain-containing protein [Sphingopyxis flava]|uniref:CHAT domain-containing protein n=1 Tax=Sphingopyxis flava TaxID=1507287 RepID=A0A1T5DYT1_9SPHN|nr:CHAT domain-containing protein [Sphingopyxis flava]SKB76656.1 CHAT domain-containing protein [Sphingopyxis flava]
MIRSWKRRLVLLLLTLCSLPGTLIAQEPPDIAAKKQAVAAAPVDQRARPGEQLLALIAKYYGTESDEYAQGLIEQSGHLRLAERRPDAHRTAERAIAILTRLHGADSLVAADAKHGFATSLIADGFREEALPWYRDYVAAMTEEAARCGRIERRPGGEVVLGCVRDEKDLGDALLLYGQLLADLGRADEGVAAFEAAITRFTPRWEGCEGAEWGISCDRAAADRRDFMSDFARYLGEVGQRERGIAILRAAALPRLEALAGCAVDACRADYWLLADFAMWKVAVGEADPVRGRELGYRWFPLLAAEPVYARGAAEGADYFEHEYRKLLDGLLKAFAEDSVIAGEKDRARTLLTAIGSSDLLAAADTSADFETQMHALRQRGEAVRHGDVAARVALEKEEAELIRRRYGASSFEYGRILRQIATTSDRLANDSETESWYRRALAVMRSAEGDDGYQVWVTLSYLSDWLVDQGRRGDAIDALREILALPVNDKSSFYADPAKARLLASGMGAISDPHGPLNDLKADFARLLLQTGGDPVEALAAARHARRGKAAWRSGIGFSREDEIVYAQSDNPSIYGGYERADYSAIYADALWTVHARDAAAAEEAFVALQEVQMGTAGAAVAKAAAERAINRGGAKALLDERREIDRQIDAIAAELPPADALMGDPYQRWYRDNLARRDRLEFRREEVDRAIAEAAPGYFEFIRPRPLTLAEAQALLAPDEAMLMIVPTEFGTHGLLVTNQSLDWHRSDLDEGRLGAHVRRLLWDVGANIDVTPEEDAKWSAEGEGDFPFDRTTAWTLYRELFARFEARLAGKQHLFTAASGAISSLPLGILVTAEPTGADGDPAALRATPWFADKVALLQLPSLQSLLLLRAVAARNDARAGVAMVGFGDPLLEGDAAPRGAGGRNRGTRSTGLPGAAGLRPAPGGGPPLADPEALRKLARLPGTESELRAMEALLGAERARLYLAREATETNIKRGKLTGLSVLFLATHGLVAGEVGGNAEPGLVFTPPVTASSADDGFLTASEVAALDLGARWVILSACNTAAGDGSAGAPGLSGLARAFFFAGAESLLASHWPVRDDVAAVLTVRLFELMRADPSLSRAEALQRAEREIRNDPRADAFLQSWAHPSAWAPFSLIGDGIH